MFGLMHSSVAQADTTIIKLSAAEIQEIEQKYADAGVDPSVTRGIIDRFQKGIIPLSDTGADPVDEHEESKHGVTKTVATYADDSISITTRPNFDALDPGLVQPLNFEGCEFVQGILGKHFGCLVTAWTLSMYLEYKFDYTYKNGVSNITS